MRDRSRSGGQAQSRAERADLPPSGRSDSSASWRHELRRSCTSVEALSRRLHLTRSELAGIERARRFGLSLRIPPALLALCDPRDPSCPIRRQIVPSAAEAATAAGDLCDPLGERAHEVAPRLIRRYPDRALLLVTDFCAVHCRFCTRAEWLAARGGAPSLRRLTPALRWLAGQPTIREVILSGGDPLTLATERLVRIVRAVRAIDHVELVRIATRVPAALPSRVTPRLVEALARYHPIWVMTHFNHPRELSADAGLACQRLVDAGFPLMNQTVLLRGVNDDPSTLTALFRGLIRWRVRPYYLLQADLARGTAHLRTPLRAGVELMAALQGRLSGIALPKLMVDTPGGLGKVPLSPPVVARRAAGRTTLATFRGVMADYVDPPGCADEAASGCADEAASGPSG